MLARLGLALALGLSPCVALGEVYKCPDAAGKNVYQDSPCDGSVKRSIPTPAQGGDWSAGMSERDRGVLYLLLQYSTCTRAFPELAGKFGSRYQEWSSNNARSIDKARSNPEYPRFQREVEKEQSQLANAAAAAREGYRTYCESTLGTALVPPSRANDKPVDVWNAMVAALRAGNVEKALEFVSPSARSRYREAFAVMAGKSAIGEIGEFKSYSQMGENLAFGLVVRTHPDGKKQGFEVGFMRDRISGAWYIESM